MAEALRRAARLAAALLKWLALGALAGAVCALAGAAFHKCISLATRWRGEQPWLVYLLPLGGLLIVFSYQRLHQSIGLGTDALFVSIREKGHVPPAMAPLIFLGTFLTHLLGGSAGREGAALQLGGSLAGGLGELLRLDRNAQRTMVMAGMAALFTALFGTPVAATFFVMEVLAMGHMMYSGLVPCAAASLTAFEITRLLGVKPEGYVISALPDMGALTLIRVAVLAALCAGLSILFCLAMQYAHKGFARLFKNPYVAIAVGGALIVGLTLLVGTRDYNGAGGEVIERAIGGSARPWDFALKLLFTAVTLGCGYKGGEIVPTFFVGATFGCAVGPLLGLDPGFAAAVAMIALFCGNTNCPIASLFLAAELFGGVAAPLFLIACAVSYELSGAFSLYHEQLALYRDLKLGGVVMPRRDGD